MAWNWAWPNYPSYLDAVKINAILHVDAVQMNWRCTMPLSPDALFAAANTLAAVGWLVLALSPAAGRWAPALRRFSGVALPLVFAVAYVVLLALNWGPGGFSTLAQVEQLFKVRELLLAGWLHYLAFDLFVGGWIAERAARLHMPFWLLVPILALTFMLGPAGLLAYALLRAAWRRQDAPIAPAAA
jgi:hypothetical protein